MSSLPVEEVSQFFRSYGLKYETDIIYEWLTKDPFSPKTNQICESDLLRFNEWFSCEGTAYEYGISDETRINRLYEEINRLRSEIEELELKNRVLEELLDIPPFNL
jgi:hypothetical protein